MNWKKLIKIISHFFDRKLSIQLFSKIESKLIIFVLFKLWKSRGKIIRRVVLNKYCIIIKTKKNLLLNSPFNFYLSKLLFYNEIKKNWFYHLGIIILEITYLTKTIECTKAQRSLGSNSWRIKRKSEGKPEEAMLKVMEREHFFGKEK